MRRKGILWFFFFLSLLIIVLGCGRKAPPTLPEKPSSLIEQSGKESREFKFISIVTDFVEVFSHVTNPKTK